MTWPFHPLPPLAGYELIVANPPLPFELYSARGEDKSYQRLHGSMPLDAIKALPVGHLARSPAVLLLTTTGPMLDVGFEILRAWGFLFKSEIVVRKLTKKGKPHRGTGYRVISRHRTFLLGVLGNPRHRKFDSLIDGVVKPGGAIPDALYAEAERCCPGAYSLDLFADAPRAGWDSWGYRAGQVEPVAQVAAPAPAEQGGLLRLAGKAA